MQILHRCIVGVLNLCQPFSNVVFCKTQCQSQMAGTSTFMSAAGGAVYTENMYTQHIHSEMNEHTINIMKHLGADASPLYPQKQLSTIPQTQQLQMHVYRISVQQCALVMQSEANQC